VPVGLPPARNRPLLPRLRAQERHPPRPHPRVKYRPRSSQAASTRPPQPCLHRIARNTCRRCSPGRRPPTRRWRISPCVSSVARAGPSICVGPARSRETTRSARKAVHSNSTATGGLTARTAGIRSPLLQSCRSASGQHLPFGRLALARVTFTGVAAAPHQGPIHSTLAREQQIKMVARPRFEPASTRR
jgi:hypothetical protein